MTANNPQNQSGEKTIAPSAPTGKQKEAEVSTAAQGSRKKGLKKPIGLKWRTSSWFITAVVGLGVATDGITYNIIVPVLPYRLQALNYTNISVLTSWLFFSYSIGIFLATFPVAYFFHKYPWRREPLVVAVLVLEGSLILFMLATPYWVMVVSRFLQGAASTVVWTVGFALICENVEEEHIGRQLGFASAGLSIGITIAPPVGGALYDRLGWHAPFIFCIVFCAADLFARLLVIERKDLAKYQDQDPSIIEPGSESDRPTSMIVTEANAGVVEKPPKKELSGLQVILALSQSPRGMTGFVITLTFGLFMGVFDPTLTLRVQSTWHKTSEFVGLIYLAASAPTFFTGPIFGALADRYGSEWIIVPSIVAALPWIPLMILNKSLPAFIIFFTLASTFVNCAMGPVGLELAMAAKAKEGISEIHQFAAMNLAFAVASAAGAPIGGQLYDHLPNGWLAVVWFMFGICVIVIPVPFFFAGEISLYGHLRGRRKVETPQEGVCQAEDLPQGVGGSYPAPV